MGVALVVIRPVTGLVAFVGSGAPWTERAVISAYGIRGVGSFSCLSQAVAEASSRERELIVAAEKRWAFVGFVVLATIFVHGVSASPVTDAVSADGDAPRAVGPDGLSPFRGAQRDQSAANDASPSASWWLCGRVIGVTLTRSFLIAWRSVPGSAAPSG